MKILFIPFAPSLAHITRCLSIAEEIKKLEYECLFAVGQEGKSIIEKAGFKTKIIPEIDSNTFKKDLGWKWLTKKYFSDNLTSELSIIDEFQPDRIVFDFRFTTALSAKIRNIKSFGIIHGNVLSLIFETNKSALDIISSDMSKTSNTIRDKIMRFLFPKIFKIILKSAIKNIRPILKKYHYLPIKLPFELLLGDINLIADIPEFIPKSIKLPNNFYISGPLMWSGWDNDDNFSFKGIDSKPIIYITMGSTVEAQSTLIKLILALKDLPYNIIISKGNLELEIKEIPKNVYIYNYVPGKKVASKSSLVIYHGGHETLMQVLSVGVPSLVIPSNPDQILVTKQIKKLGIGDYLKNPNSFPMDKDPLKNISIEDIKIKVVYLIDNKEIKDKCNTIKIILNQYIESKLYIKQIIDS